MTGHERLVVCALGLRGGPLELPGSDFDPGSTFISGGERSLYELAVAAATLGVDVELRGAINRPILDEITSAAGAAPTVGRPARRPEPSDLIVLPEVFDRDVLAGAWLSGAAVVLYLLAPPGLFGWSFLDGWERPDLHTGQLDGVGAPESFRAIAGLGVGMWTNARGIEAAGARAGVAVTWLGTGTPVPFPDPGPKTHDLAVVTHNRWSAVAADIARSIEGARVLAVPPVPGVYSLAPYLAPARILLWPSRVEGMSRISREARSVGTVPVSLDTNPFALASDHGGGVVLVPDRPALVESAARLLADPARLEVLAAEGRTSVAEQADWRAFVGRVAEALGSATAGPAAQARAGLGAGLISSVADLSAAQAQLAAVTAERDAHRARLVARLVDRSRLGPAYASWRDRRRR